MMSIILTIQDKDIIDELITKMENDIKKSNDILNNIIDKKEKHINKVLDEMDSLPWWRFFKKLNTQQIIDNVSADLYSIELHLATYDIEKFELLDNLRFIQKHNILITRNITIPMWAYKKYMNGNKKSLSNES